MTMADESKLRPVHVKIRNFQSIEELDVEVRGFTCVTGKTNIGKSAILRAVSSALLGDPVTGMVRKGAAYCSVELTSESWGFRWEKGEKGVNRYHIGGTTHDKPGQRQLDEVARMGFGSVKLGSKEIQPWWASQFSPIFLLGETGPAVTDFISEVSRLTVLQDAIVLSSRGKRKANDEAKSKADAAQKIRDRLQGVAALDPLVRLADELAEQAASIGEYESRAALGDALQEKLESCARRIQAFQGAERVRVPEDEVGELVSQSASLFRFWMRLEAHARRIIALRAAEKVEVPEAPQEEFDRHVRARRFAGIDRLKKRAKLLERSEKVDVPDGAETRTALDSARTAALLADRLSGLRTKESALSGAVDVPDDPGGPEGLRKAEEMARKLSALRSNEQALQKRVEAADSELDKLDKLIAAIPACPSCGRPVAAGEHKAGRGHAVARA